MAMHTDQTSYPALLVCATCGEEKGMLGEPLLTQEKHFEVGGPVWVGISSSSKLSSTVDAKGTSFCIADKALSCTKWQCGSLLVPSMDSRLRRLYRKYRTSQA